MTATEQQAAVQSTGISDQPASRRASANPCEPDEASAASVCSTLATRSTYLFAPRLPVQVLRLDRSYMPQLQAPEMVSRG